MRNNVLLTVFVLFSFFNFSFSQTKKVENLEFAGKQIVVFEKVGFKYEAQSFKESKKFFENTPKGVVFITFLGKGENIAESTVYKTVDGCYAVDNFKRISLLGDYTDGSYKVKVNKKHKCSFQIIYWRVDEHGQYIQRK